MKQTKRKKAFTLIELLAVIVILAIIALIAIPVVMNIIDKANKSAFKDSAYGILKAGELYYSDKLIQSELVEEDITFTFPNNIEGLEIDGNKPTGGTMIINTKGQIFLAITNGKYCVTKNFEDEDVTISDNVDKCELDEENESNTGGNTEETPKDDAEENILITDLEVYGPRDWLYTGSEYQLIVNISPSNATNQKLKYTSSDENLATVDENGLITAKNITENPVTITIETTDGSNIVKTVSFIIQMAEPA